MATKRNKTPTKTAYPTIIKANDKSPSPIPHATSTMLPDPNTQHNLNIALQLAQYHKKEAHLYREKCQMLEGKLKEKQKMIGEMGQGMETGRKDNEKLLKKYKKMKTKYKNLCEEQQPLSDKRNQPQFSKQLVSRSPIFERKRSQSPQQNILLQQINEKNKTIYVLSEKVHECEVNTVEILKLVNVLQQKVQELTMDNSLLRGIVREKHRMSSESSRQITLD